MITFVFKIELKSNENGQKMGVSEMTLFIFSDGFDIDISKAKSNWNSPIKKNEKIRRANVYSKIFDFFKNNLYLPFFEIHLVL